MKRIVLYAITILCSVNLYAQTQPTDTDSDGYYNISTLDHLRWVSENDSSWTWNFELDNDIDASDTKNWNSGSGWDPIGTSGTKYSGKFDGHGYEIDSLYINRSANNYVGFFGSLNSDAVIKGIGLTNTNITGRFAVGALVGQNNSGSVISCFSGGSVTGYSRVAGLIGKSTSSSSVKESYSTCSVDGTLSGGDDMAGGLIGENDGAVISCYATGDVSAKKNIGGLLGWVSPNSSVKNCYATGDVSGTSGTAGGFAGKNYQGTLEYCYATGAASASWQEGGFLGANQSGTNTGCYWDKTTSGLNNSAAGTGKTTTEMKTKSTYSNWDFDSTWAMHSSKNDGYPVHQWQYPDTSGSDSSIAEKPADTDSDGYYNISKLAHLRWISENDSSWTWNFELDNDINAAETRTWNVGDHDGDTSTVDSAMGWRPIGDTTANYKGIFRGSGYKIDSLYINQPNSFRVGLFGSADSADISGIHISDCDIRGHYYVAGLAGYLSDTDVSVCSSSGEVSGRYATGGIAGRLYSSSTIDSCSSSCKISGYFYSGGISGYSYYSDIKRSFATGDVSGYYYTGGLSGYNYSVDISDCYAKGKSDGSFYSGGLTGYLSSSSLADCYSTGNVPTANNSGGLVGYKASSTVSDCFWDTQTSNQSTSAGGIGKTTAQMKSEAIFKFAWWDFDSTWAMQSARNSGYPYLQWEYPEIKNRGIAFDGNNDYIETNLDASCSAMSETTWEAWIYPERTGYGTRQSILSIDDGGYDRTVYIEQNTAKFAVHVGNFHVFEGPEVNLNTWQHVAVVWGSDFIKFYKNGEEFLYRFVPITSTTNYDLHIGRRAQSGEYFKGKIDDVRIWSDVRTGQEIIENMTSESDLYDDGKLEAHFKFNEESGDTVFSSSTIYGIKNGAASFERTDDYVPGTKINLTSPSDEASDESVTPTLEWQEISDATHYYIVIGSDSSLADQVFFTDINAIDGTEVTIPEGCLYCGSEFYWGVFAKNDSTFFALSDIRSFTTKDCKTAVEPFITDNWNTYRWPMNAYYPDDPNGSAGLHYKVGNACGPTMRTRVKHYWEHPYRGRDSLNWTDRSSFNWKANFDTTVYRWDLMKDTVNGSDPESIYKWPATLMHHSAVAIYDYWGSGRDLFDIAEYEHEHFRYDSNCYVEQRWHYTKEKWIALIKGELDRGRPVMVMARTASSPKPWENGNFDGHYYIIDGYNSDDKFHTAYGFGYYPDYYDIDSIGNYNSYLEVLINFRPEYSEIRPRLLSPDDNIEQDINQDLKLNWKDVLYTDKYHVKASGKKDFSSEIVVNRPDLDSSHYVLGSSSLSIWQMTGKDTIYWKVRAFGDGDTTDWSETRMFYFESTSAKLLTTTQYLHGLWNGTSHEPAGILCELRSGSDLPTSTLTKRLPGIIDSTGEAKFDFASVSDGDYWTVVRAPGYLPLGTTSKISLSSAGTSYDFTTGTGAAAGGDRALYYNGTDYLMRGGDYNGDRRSSATDIAPLSTSYGKNVRTSVPALSNAFSDLSTGGKEIEVQLYMHGLYNGTTHEPAPLTCEIRSGSDLMSSTLVKRVAGAVDSSGKALFDFGDAADGTYWIVVRAAGFLPLGATGTVTLSSTKTSYDFTIGTGAAAGGDRALYYNGTDYLMRGGDYNGDRRSSATDIAPLSTSYGKNLRTYVPEP